MYENSTHICTIRSDVFSGTYSFVIGDASVFVASCELCSIQKGLFSPIVELIPAQGLRKGYEFYI